MPTPDDLACRNNITLQGEGRTTVVFAHGFGCDQTMWQWMEPSFRTTCRTVLLDLVGSGKSDLSAYIPGKYDTLHGHAGDIVEIIRAFGQGPVVFVGHSVSATIGMLADLAAPDLIAAHVMIGPSPRYIDDGDYVGGFSRTDIDALLQTMDDNYLVWASAMAPAIMGAPDQPALGSALANSFCRTDPEIAKHFARVIFLSDHRAELQRLRAPTLIIQSHDDFIAPMAVGMYVHGHVRDSRLEIVNNVGHCPHVSAPAECTKAVTAYMREIALG